MGEIKPKEIEIKEAELKALRERVTILENNTTVQQYLSTKAQADKTALELFTTLQNRKSNTGTKTRVFTPSKNSNTNNSNK